MSNEDQFPTYTGRSDSAAPQPTPAAGPPVEVPPQVNIGFWLYIAAAALSLVTLIVSVATIGAAKTEIRNQLAARNEHVSAASLNSLIGLSVGAAVVGGILFLAAYVLFAFFMRRGANWARIVLLIVTVLSIFSVTSEYGLGAVRLVLGAIATVLIFLRPANEYFRGVKARKVRRV
jgi:hypothetical protein